MHRQEDDTTWVLTTADTLGSFSAERSSWGTTPGLPAICQTIDQRWGRASRLWIDTGDILQCSRYVGGDALERAGRFLSALDGPDLIVAGNHEFDWGLPALLDVQRMYSLPILASDTVIGQTIAYRRTADALIAVIGWTRCAENALYPRGISADRRLGALVRRARSSGARYVVVAIHDGADEIHGVASVSRLESELGDELQGADCLLLGHTLARFVGTVADIPAVQPGSHTSEIGCVRLPDGEVSIHEPLCVEEPSEWGDATVIGECPFPLLNAPGRDVSLLDFAADCVTRLTRVASAIVPTQALMLGQAPRDGCFAYIPEGPVTRGMVWRLSPWLDDSLWVCELEDPLHLLLQIGSAGWSLRPDASSGPLSVAARGFDRPAFERAAGRRLTWRQTSTTMREALEAGFRR